jgi:hypothetical protein
MTKKKFKWILEVEIDEIWVAYGYKATAENIKDAIMSHSLCYAYNQEVKVKQLSKPDKRSVDEAQRCIRPAHGRS